MNAITEFVVTRGDMQTVMWLMIAVVLAVVYALVKDRSIFYMMASSLITCVVSFSLMTLSGQVITFLIIYLLLYIGLSFKNKFYKGKSKR